MVDGFSRFVGDAVVQGFRCRQGCRAADDVAEPGDIDGFIHHRLGNLRIPASRLGSGPHFSAHGGDDLLLRLFPGAGDRRDGADLGPFDHDDLVAGEGDEGAGGDRLAIDEGDGQRISVEDGVLDEGRRIDTPAEGVDVEEDGVHASFVGVNDRALDERRDARVDHLALSSHGVDLQLVDEGALLAEGIR